MERRYTWNFTVYFAFLQDLMDRGMPSRDYRFRRLHTTLSPAMTRQEDEYPAENLTSKARMSKYTPSLPATSYQPDSLPSRQQEARVMVASRGKPIPLGLEPPPGGHLPHPQGASSAGGSRPRTHEIDFVTERKTGGGGLGDAGGSGGGGE